MIEAITWNHFFLETKDKITPELYRLLHPDMKFGKVGKVYISAETQGETFVVLMAIGENAQFYREIATQAKKSGFKFVKFTTSLNNKVVKTIAKYYGCKQTAIHQDFYGEGLHAVEFVGDLYGPRFKVN